MTTAIVAVPARPQAFFVGPQPEHFRKLPIFSGHRAEVFRIQRRTHLDVYARIWTGFYAWVGVDYLVGSYGTTVLDRCYHAVPIYHKVRVPGLRKEFA